jgi:hypothetical protein
MTKQSQTECLFGRSNHFEDQESWKERREQMEMTGLMASCRTLKCGALVLDSSFLSIMMSRWRIHGVFFTKKTVNQERLIIVRAWEMCVPLASWYCENSFLNPADKGRCVMFAHTRMVKARVL